MNLLQKSSYTRSAIIFLSLLLSFAVILVLNVNTGSINISPSEIFKIVFFKSGAGSVEFNIIWKIRLPRLLAAAVLGGALSVSGYLLQTFFRNPIAGPFVLGISSGAKMFVGIVMVALMEKMQSIPLSIIIIASFLGSLLSTGFVLAFAHKVQNMSMLLIVGIMVGYICTAVTDFFVTFAEESDIANLTHWSMGSFSGMNWENLAVAALLVSITMLLTFMFIKPIGVYQLGEGYAQSLGVNIRIFRVILIFLSSMLSACVTAFAGPISFVGIAVPHIAKLLFATAKPIIILPGSFLCGAVFCMFCDLIARTAFSPVELAIGTVTAVFGAPVVIWLMVSNKERR